MKDSFDKLCKEINFIIPNHLKGSILNEIIQQNSINNTETERKILVKITFFSIPFYEELWNLSQKITNFFLPYIVEFDYQIKNKNFNNLNIFSLIKFYFAFKKNEDISALFDENNIDFNINTNIFKIMTISNLKYHLILEKEHEIKEALRYFYLNNEIELKIENNAKSFIENEEKQIEKQNENNYFEILEQRKINSLELVNSKNSNNKSFNKNNNYKKQQYSLTNLSNFYLTEDNWLSVEGMIFQHDIFITKNNLKIFTIQITDFNEAIIAKMFINNENENLQWIDNNKFVSIQGEKKVGYNGELYLQIKNINEIKKNKKIDEAKEKRIELSIRSSMSAMDGFISANKFLEFAKENNYKSLAIVDFQNIQAFPEIYNYSKKIGIKPIYGSTFSTIHSSNGIVTNLKNNANIDNEKYIIFDIETTSLNPRIGEIIEFGAVEVINGKIISTYQFFIKPKNKISTFTSNLTGITQQMLDSNQSIKDEKIALKKIIKIFSDATLVAHNAKFDIGFINEKLSQHNLNEINNQIIDSLALARYLIETSQNYRLETVSKKYGVLYDPTISHRADYDANVLEQVWIKMINDLKRRNIENFVQLNQLSANHIHNKKIPYDLTIYVKNQKGLKELFKFISKSSIDWYYNGPRLFYDQLNKSKNLIFAPTSLNSRLVDLMFNGTTKEIKEEINKWDFIGIPSPHLLVHYMNNNQYTKNEIENFIKQVILIAKQMNKIIVAIGDVRYFDDNQRIAHHIYINTKGLEGRRHPLYRYNDTNPIYPIQKFLTTNEMKKQFEFLKDENLIDEIVVKNSNLINGMIEDNIEVIKSKLYTPNFDNSVDKLQKLVYENAYNIYGKELPKIIEERIKRELEPIIKYGFSVIYWISHKLVAKSNQDGYLVGSRGSVGSSLVATLSGITEVNPLSPHYICSHCKYFEIVDNAPTISGFDLPNKNCPKCNNVLNRDGQTIPFETFLGFNADKVPDIDLNFSGIYQPIIHQEVKNMFGESHCFRAGTIGTVAAKTAFGFVKKWNEETNSNKSSAFVNYLSILIEGSKRTTGQHPGGIIIIPKEFEAEDFTPINYPANDINSTWKTTHFDFHAIHDNVLKLDLLGHDDPTIIRFLQKKTNVDLKNISFSDPEVMSLFTSTKSLNIEPKDINNEPTGVLGIPEFGTKFVRKMLHVAKPRTFNDLINLSGLSHGTDVWSGNAEELIKNGLTLNDVISCRDDIMVYLIKKGIEPLISFNIMEKVRKGKGLDSKDEEILKSKNIDQWYINSLNKIKYMFPRAHAMAYVTMAWRIAWFKINYPLEYYASYYSIRSTSFDIDIALKSKYEIEKKLNDLLNKQKNKQESKISTKEEEFIPTLEIINEMKARGINISNINLYKSKAIEWDIDYENNELIPPFLIIDGLGETAANSVIEARDEKKFSSIEDLMNRTQLNKTVVEKLISLGVFKDLDETDQLKLF